MQVGYSVNGLKFLPRYLPLWSSKTETRLDMQRVLVRGISMSVNLCNSMCCDPDHD